MPRGERKIDRQARCANVDIMRASIGERCTILIAACCVLTVSGFQPPMTGTSTGRTTCTMSSCRPKTNMPLSAATGAASNYGPAFCQQCGTKTTIMIPEGDERERHVCSDPECGYIAYQNPKVVVGAICTYEKDKVLLCQRAIEPCKGKWGYPQGFMELGETTRQGAARETLEEAGVTFNPEVAQLLRSEEVMPK